MDVRLSVGLDNLVVAVPTRMWEEVHSNRMVVAPRTDGGRMICAIGDRSIDPVPPGARTYRVPSLEDFDPHLVAAAMRFWVSYAVSKASTRREVRARLARSTIDLVWQDWSFLDVGQRTAFLELVAAFADVRVNGTVRATSPRLRRLVGRKATIHP